MGCCYSLPSTVDPIQDQTTDASSEPRNGRREDPPLTKFSFYDLKMATRYFSPENIVTEHGFDIVFKGRLQNGSVIAIKIFNSMVWPDPNLFVEEAQRVGRLRHKRIVNLIGYCCDGDKRLLVADFMPNDTLAKRLFQRKHQTMDWPTRLRVAYGVAEALCYCNTAGFASYNNLSAYKVLFDEVYIRQINSGSVNPHNMTYKFGTILVNLLSGKQIPPSHAPEMIHRKTLVQLMDPYLKGRFSMDEATAVLNLAIQCLQHEDQESPNTREIVEELETLLARAEAPSHEVIETTTQQEEVSSSNRTSPLGEACSRMDLASIHKIMVSTAYDDDKDFIELSFEEWIQEVKELQDVRKQGDQAFVEQDFKPAIDCYSQFIEARSMVYPSVYARRSLCYIFCNEPDKALLDGMAAQSVYPDWPTAFYLQSVALAKLNMNIDSTNTLKEAAILEAKKRHQ
ncbi:PREDICTED: probable inactive receptor-like kinase SSP [Camelina sativa]|uniref:Serine/threonine-protein kinase BSK n=1 Tax=Camelina sativa TaxID=90675 RepID=A0ABM1QIR3_CAMSA|nr:PREDICTED: probable inactive receptor-like kinase SSP [Camelina sativa]